MIVKRIFYFLFVFVFFAISIHFKTDTSTNNDCSIRLKWYKSYEGETWSKVRTGLLWSFSYMGAKLPKGSLESSIVFTDSTNFEINLNQLGFDQSALTALNIICDNIKSSEEYKKNKFIDLSRFLVLTLYAPYNYYKITGAETSYNNFLSKYPMEDSLVFGVTKSIVSKGHRRIRFSKSNLANGMAMVAEEGYGSLQNNTFKPVKFETITILPNGQLKYAIYDKNGSLVDAANPEFSSAGKPGKCMWCHEIVIQPLFVQNEAVNNMMTNEQFKDKVEALQLQLINYRKELSSDIDFNKRQEHTESELLYISFMEPSLFRLRQEFDNDSMALRKILNLTTHIYNEFPFLGNLYRRKKIDRYFSYKRIRIPEFVREKSAHEPDYFRYLKK